MKYEPHTDDSLKLNIKKVSDSSYHYQSATEDELL